MVHRHKLVVAVAIVFGAAFLVSCGDASQAPTDASGGSSTMSATSTDLAGLDDFAEGMLQLKSESSNFSNSMDDNMGLTESEIQEASDPFQFIANATLEASERSQQFAKNYDFYCTVAEEGLTGTSGPEQQAWRAGKEWCEASVDNWSRISEIHTEMAVQLANHEEPNLSSDSSLREAQVAMNYLGDKFGDAYCAIGGNFGC